MLENHVYSNKKIIDWNFDDTGNRRPNNPKKQHVIVYGTLEITYEKGSNGGMLSALFSDKKKTKQKINDIYSLIYDTQSNRVKISLRVKGDKDSGINDYCQIQKCEIQLGYTNQEPLRF